MRVGGSRCATPTCTTVGLTDRVGTVWVYTRYHTVAGPYVEVHADAPDGPLLRRVAVAHALEAVSIVDDLRDAMLRGGRESVVGEIDRIGCRGSVVVHVGSHRSGTPIAALGTGRPTRTCARIWTAAGTCEVRAALVRLASDERLEDAVARHPRWLYQHVEVDEGETAEVFHSVVRSRLVVGRPRLHAPCPVRDDRHPLVVWT